MLFDADVFVRVVNFPNTASRAAVEENEDGTYSLYVNARCTREQIMERMPHEIVHMKDRHHQDARPVEALEEEADEATDEEEQDAIPLFLQPVG